MIVDDYQVLCNTGSLNKQLISLDKFNGRLNWTVDDPALEKAFGTPLVIPQGEGSELLLLMNGKISSRSPRTGAETWIVTMPKGGWMPPSLSFDETRIYASCSETTLAIRRDSSMSADEEERVEWSMSDGGSDYTTPIICGDSLATLDRSILTIRSATDGEIVTKRRLPHKDNDSGLSASLVASGDYLFAQLLDGTCHVIDIADGFAIKHTNYIEEANPNFLATPALLQDRMLIRSDAFLYCIGE